MLRAIIHSKDRNIVINRQILDKEEGINFRTLYPQIEDFLTATIFERLCYLPGENLWDLLRKASGDFLPQTAGPLEKREFWPHWPIMSGERERVEPDLFLRFRDCDCIIEAKRVDFGNCQDTDQLEWEQKAYNQNYSGDKKPVYIIAIGGCWLGLQESLIAKSLNCIKSISWHTLFMAIKESTDLNQFLRDDLLAAFELHGIRETLWLTDLIAEWAKSFYSGLNFLPTIDKLIKGIHHPPDWDGFYDLTTWAKIENLTDILEVLEWK